MKGSGTGLSLCSALFIVFLVLKLTNNITWSWWWVVSPLWIPFAFVILLLITIFLLYLIIISL